MKSSVEEEIGGKKERMGFHISGNKVNLLNDTVEIFSINFTHLCLCLEAGWSHEKITWIFLVK
jgi:hypothetical protein